MANPIGSHPTPTPYRTLVQVGEMLQYRGPNIGTSARKFCLRGGVPFYRRGRALMVHIDDIHEVLSTGRCVAGLARRQRELEAQTNPRALRGVAGGRR